MHLAPGLLRALDGSQSWRLSQFAGCRVNAVAGIANPKRFFDLLRRHGLEIEPHAFPDHHAYTASDLSFADGRPVLMTEKDAVKCRRLPCRDCWVVRVDAQPDAGFVHRLNTALKELDDGQKTAGHPGLPDL